MIANIHYNTAAMNKLTEESLKKWLNKVSPYQIEYEEFRLVSVVNPGIAGKVRTLKFKDSQAYNSVSTYAVDYANQTVTVRFGVALPDPSKWLRLYKDFEIQDFPP